MFNDRVPYLQAGRCLINLLGPLTVKAGSLSVCKCISIGLCTVLTFLPPQFSVTVWYSP